MQKKNNKQVFTIIGIATGVFSVFLITVICFTGKEIFNRSLSSMGFNCITINAADSNLNTLTDEDMIFTIGNDSVVSAAPLMVGMGQATNSRVISNTIIGGIDNRSAKIFGVEILYGRLFNTSEILKNKKVCIISDAMAEDFFHRKNVIGKEINLTVDGINELFEIIGISTAQNNYLMSAVGDYVPYFVYIPYTSFMDIASTRNISNILVEIDKKADFDTVGKSLTDKLNLKYGYENLYKYENLSSQKEKLDEILNIVTLLLVAIGFISFVVSGMGIITVMLSSIKEQTKEIGIKRAIGATDFDIMKDFLIKAVILNAQGCILGLCILLTIILPIKIFVDIPIIIPYALLSKILIIMLVFGMIFGVYPAMSATKLNPVDALRSE